MDTYCDIITKNIKRDALIDYFINDNFIKDNQIPVIFDLYSNTKAIMMVPSDKEGRPLMQEIQYLYYNNYDYIQNNLASSNLIQKTLYIKELISYKELNTPNLKNKRIYSLWKGEIIQEKIIPVDQIPLKKLLQISNKLINEREYFLVEEANNYKLILNNINSIKL